MTATQLYSPYGGVRYQSGILPTDIGFTHQRADATTGLDDYAARWYDPLAGQFASADTTLAGGLNRYAYVAGNPETNTDPSGHILRPPTPTTHGYRPQTAYTQWLAQPSQHTYYGSVKAFVSGLPQFILGTDTLSQSFHTLFQDPKASLGDKAKALGVGLFTVVTDTLTVGSLFVGEPEVGADLRSFDEGLLGATDAKAAVAATTDGLVTDGLAGDASGVAADLCGESFTASTLVATPSGERPIAALRVGQHVSAYDPQTGKQTTQTIEQVFINHDSDRLDVTLAYTSAHSATPSQDAQDATNRPNSGHRRSMPAKDVAPAGPTEVIHTTASHPWLTADHGWARAGTLHVGEAVRLLNGATATVVRLRMLPGVAPMWDLSLDATHTFAVGTAQAVVHNCEALSNAEATARATEIAQTVQPYPISRSWGTVGVGSVQEADGTVSQVVGLSNGASKTMERTVMSALDPAETWLPRDIPGGSEVHAEDYILKYAGKDGRTLLSLGTSNTVCDICEIKVDQAWPGLLDR